MADENQEITCIDVVVDLLPEEQQHALIAEYQDYLIMMTSPDRTPITEAAGNLWLMLLIFCAAVGKPYGIFPCHVNAVPPIAGLPGHETSILLGELYRAGLVKLNGPEFLYIPEMVRRKAENVAGGEPPPITRH